MPGRTKVLGFALQQVCPEIPLDRNPFHEWYLSDGSVWAQFFRIGDEGYLIRFPEFACFTVSRDGQSVLAYPVGETSMPTLEHLFQSQVLPLAQSRQMKLVLHASAIEVAGSAVAFLGHSGWGKSTLAASFASHGYGFLTDDGLQIDQQSGGYSVTPSHPSIRLWEDSRDALVLADAIHTEPAAYTSKMRILAAGELTFCDSARPLRCMYFLGDGQSEDVEIEDVRGRDVLLRLVKHSFLLDIDAREMLEHHFLRLTDLAKQARFYKLDYPREYAILPEVRDKVFNHLAGLPNPAAPGQTN